MNLEAIFSAIILIVLTVSPPIVKQLVKTATKEIIDEQTQILFNDFREVKIRQDKFEETVTTELTTVMNDLNLLKERVVRIESKTAILPSVSAVVDEIKEKVSETA